MTKLLVTSYDIVNLIERSENTDEEKQSFKKTVMVSECTEGVAYLELFFDNGQSIVLKGITMQNLIFNDVENNDFQTF